MEVKDIYQDDNGVWHIDYRCEHLMGLAIRNWLGGLIISLIIYIPLAIGAFILGIQFGEPTLNESKQLENQFNIPETEKLEEVENPLK